MELQKDQEVWIRATVKGHFIGNIWTLQIEDYFTPSQSVDISVVVKEDDISVIDRGPKKEVIGSWTPARFNEESLTKIENRVADLENKLVNYQQLIDRICLLESDGATRQEQDEFLETQKRVDQLERDMETTNEAITKVQKESGHPDIHKWLLSGNPMCCGLPTEYNGPAGYVCGQCGRIIRTPGESFMSSLIDDWATPYDDWWDHAPTPTSWDHEEPKIPHAAPAEGEDEILISIAYNKETGAMTSWAANKVMGPIEQEALRWFGEGPPEDPDVFERHEQYKREHWDEIYRATNPYWKCVQCGSFQSLTDERCKDCGQKCLEEPRTGEEIINTLSTHKNTDTSDE